MKKINLFKTVIILIALVSSTGFTYSLVASDLFKDIGLVPTMFILIGVTSIAAIIEAYFDAKKWIGVKHGESALLRGVFITAHCLVIYPFTPFIILPIMICLVSFWAVFDPTINLFKGKEWSYIGNTSFIDKIARKYLKQNGGIYLGIKLLIWLALFLTYMFI